MATNHCHCLVFVFSCHLNFYPGVTILGHTVIPDVKHLCTKTHK